MTYEEALTKAKEMVTAAKEVVIVTHTAPTMDSIGSSLALMLGIVSLGKKATVVCADPMTVELSNFVGVDRVVRDFGKKNFVISLDYTDGAIEKVSYNIEGKKFNLVVEHRPGFEVMTKDNVQYAYQGVSADLIVSVDTLSLADLGSVYDNHKDVFEKTQIINVDFHNENVNYGALNLVDPGASTTTELVAELMATMGVKLTADIATNLLNAIYAATGNFQSPSVTSMAFEVASVCMKAGAKRFGAEPAPVQRPAQQVQQQPTRMPEPAPVRPQEVPDTAVPEPRIYVNKQPVATEQRPEPVQKQQTPQPAPAPVQEAADGKKPAQPPSDWLKPKIFKSSGSLL